MHAVTASGEVLLKGPQMQVLLVHSVNVKNGAHGVVQLANCRGTTFPLNVPKSVPRATLTADKTDNKEKYTNCR